MRKPNFLIVGAAKSGTTSLFEYLRRHPDVYMPKCKDIGYFSDQDDSDVQNVEDYYRFFAPAKQQKRIGEASVAYLYSRDAPTRIVQQLGAGIKIIILLRHPVMMAQSLWGQNVRDTGETLSFEEAIKAEPDRMKDDRFKKQIKGWWIYNYAYIDRARYAPQVGRYFRAFGQSNVRVYIYEKFFDNIENSFADVCNFLDIGPSFALPKYERFNPAGAVKSKLLHKLYSERMIWTEPLRVLLPVPLRRGIMMTLYNLNTTVKPLPPLSAATKNRLLDYFRDDIDELERLLDIPLHDIWN